MSAIKAVKGFGNIQPSCLHTPAVDDYTPFEGLELTFTAGATRVCEPLLVAQDDLVEENEYFSVSITRTFTFGVGLITSLQMTIQDSDRKFMTVHVIYSLAV